MEHTMTIREKQKAVADMFRIEAAARGRKDIEGLADHVEKGMSPDEDEYHRALIDWWYENIDKDKHVEKLSRNPTQHFYGIPWTDPEFLKRIPEKEVAERLQKLQNILSGYKNLEKVMYEIHNTYEAYRKGILPEKYMEWMLNTAIGKYNEQNQRFEEKKVKSHIAGDILRIGDVARAAIEGKPSNTEIEITRSEKYTFTQNNEYLASIGSRDD